MQLPPRQPGDATAIGFVTDAGLETDLIYRQGFDLPEFAAFPLVDGSAGRHVLSAYYRDFATIAAAAGAGLLLETPTWRASHDWGRRLGYDDAALADSNAAAVRLLRDLAKAWRDDLIAVEVSGQIGPKGDGYRPDVELSVDEAAAYHRPQLQALADAGADRCSALTLTTTDEALGVIAAAREVGIPITVGFTVETDGRLPDGTQLKAAIERVVDVQAPDAFLVNCAHPDHIAPALESTDLETMALENTALENMASGGPHEADSREWARWIRGLRVNASTLSHAELDAATELDAGDPDRLAIAHAALVERLAAYAAGADGADGAAGADGTAGAAGADKTVAPLSVIGGCCGTDARHVAAIWGVQDALPAPA